MPRSFASVLPALAAALGLCLAAAGPVRAAAPDDLASLYLEVAALRDLRDLDLTAAQLDKLAALAKGAASAHAPTSAQGSKRLRTALVNLYNALLEGDAPRINACEEKLDEAEADDVPEVDTIPTITDAARRRVAEAMRLLTVRQLVAFLAGSDLPDPFEQLTEGFEGVRGLGAEDVKPVSRLVADQVGWLLHGLDPAAGAKTREQVVALLGRVHALKDADYKKQRPQLEEEARKITEKVAATTVLAHIAEHRLAELLSNPRLGPAIAALPKKSAGKTTGP